MITAGAVLVKPFEGRTDRRRRDHKIGAAVLREAKEMAGKDIALGDGTQMVATQIVFADAGTQRHLEGKKIG